MKPEKSPSCGIFEQELAAFVAGSLSREQMRRLKEHSKDCPDCGSLLEIAVGRATPQAPADFLDMVVRQTSGPACPQVRFKLPGFVDHEADPVETSLLASHLEGCGQCAELAAELRQLGEELPGLFEADPGPGFTERVLLATSLAHRPGRPLWHQKVARAWYGLLRRPSFAMETAYAGSLLLFGLAGLLGIGVPESSQALSSTAGLTYQRAADTLEMVSKRAVAISATGDAWLQDLAAKRESLSNRIPVCLSDWTTAVVREGQRYAGTLAEGVSHYFEEFRSNLEWQSEAEPPIGSCPENLSDERCVNPVDR